MRKILRQFNATERAILRPHWEAHCVYLALVHKLDPRTAETGVQYDGETGQVFVDVPEPESGE